MTRQYTFLTATAALFLFGASASAASFNCHKASTKTEKAICSDHHLNRLDEKMGHLYQKAKHYQHDLPKYQKEWIRNRNSECSADTRCLTKWTQNRIVNFENIIHDAKAGKRVNAPKKHPSHGKVYFPEHGIVCDRVGKFCADIEGISMGFTQEYFGEAAANRLANLAERDHMDISAYTLSNGIFCDSHLKKCYNNKWKEKVDKHYTAKLFH